MKYRIMEIERNAFYQSDGSPCRTPVSGWMTLTDAWRELCAYKDESYCRFYHAIESEHGDFVMPEDIPQDILEQVADEV